MTIGKAQPIRVIEELEAEVVFYDPYVPEYHERGNIVKGETALTKELLESADLVIITTAHTTIDYDFVNNILS